MVYEVNSFLRMDDLKLLRNGRPENRLTIACTISLVDMLVRVYSLLH